MGGKSVQLILSVVCAEYWLSAAVLRLGGNNKKTKTQREVFILVAAR